MSEYLPRTSWSSEYHRLLSSPHPPLFPFLNTLSVLYILLRPLSQSRNCNAEFLIDKHVQTLSSVRRRPGVETRSRICTNTQALPSTCHLPPATCEPPDPPLTLYIRILVATSPKKDLPDSPEEVGHIVESSDGGFGVRVTPSIYISEGTRP
ncbi:hypothetical protein K504DRAFT_47037 [Pleomassaria siparia CBS 279.74]|uniref:Uncharacterized protein n=1 Tax=Pleomassaria siparia CBS 279.74 TaxID=1314801 RepID=A0A6G1K594_9PLEO|nr:hypothetical protein K504DRAFT_47037 [Pleomassaria siparia CBS 279.74]